MRANIKPFTKEEINAITDFMQKEVLTDNNDEIIIGRTVLRFNE